MGAGAAVFPRARLDGRFFGRHRFASQRSLLDVQVFRLKQPGVGGHEISSD